MATGMTIEVNPKTANKLKIFEPIKFPMERPGWFLYAATHDATNSGNEVPKATIVTATTDSEMCKTVNAIVLALSINKPAP